MEQTQIIWQELKNLRDGYDDLRKEIANITNKKNEATQTSRRGAFANSGVTAERILKYIYRKEGKESGGKPADKLEINDLISELSERSKPSILPPHVVSHLRTVQAWRNLGVHDKGDFNDVNDDTLIGVNIALNSVVTWFFENYLGGEFAELANNEEIKINTSESVNGFNESEKIWQDYFWYVNRNESIRAIEISYLNSLQLKYNINDDRIVKLKSGYLRNYQEFIELIEQALEDSKLETFEAEAIEHARETCCISKLEAKEIFISALENIKFDFTDSGSFSVEWLNEIFETLKNKKSKSQNRSGKIYDQNNSLFKNETQNLSNDQLAYNDENLTCQNKTLHGITSPKEIEIIIQDEKVEIFTEGGSEYLIKFKPSFLSRLDFCFFIDKNDFFIHSLSNSLLVISQGKPDNFLSPNKNDRRDLKTSSGLGYVKINIPDSKNEFLPDWKKNLISADQDQDISMLIETFPNEPNKFNLTIKIGKYNKKLRLSFGTYYINEMNTEKRNYFQK